MAIGKQIWIICLLAAISQAQGSSDDRFIKKYAMMKIYESCFGPEVVKQIRQEMKDACAKCAAAPSLDLPLNPNPASPALLGKLPPGFAMDPNSQNMMTKPNFNDNSGSMDSQENDLPSGQPEQPQLNVGKLTQSIMAFRPQVPPFQPPQPSGTPPYMVPAANQFRPYAGPAAPFYQLPYGGVPNPAVYYAGAGGLGFNPYSGGQYQPQYQPQGYFQQPYYGATHRMSRAMDLRDRFDMITHGSGGGGGGGGGSKVRNITCVMQELGYLDYNMEPNYEKITQRIANLPVSSELKGDIQDGLQFCQKFAQCVPEVKRDVSPLSKELIRPMFFFRCYKHKKLEACIMKDIRERFTSEDDLESDADTDFRSLARSGKALRAGEGVAGLAGGDPQMEALDEMSVYLYDFLSGSNNFDFDLYM